MFRNYRHFIPALSCATVAVAAISTWELYPERPQLTGYTATQEQQLNYRAGGPDCLPAEIADLKSRERARRVIACREAEEQHRLSTNDLIQQRRAADAASGSAILAYEQARIAAWGVFLGIVTTGGAIAAALSATQAAASSRRQLMLQFRPKLIVHQISLPLDVNSPTGSLNVVNEGAMDAKIESSGVSVFMYDSSLPQTFPLTEGNKLNEIGNIDIAAGEFQRWNFNNTISNRSQIRSILRGKIRLYVMGRIRYRDADGLIHRTLFCRRYDPMTNRFVPDGVQDFEYES